LLLVEMIRPKSPRLPMICPVFGSMLVEGTALKLLIGLAKFARPSIGHDGLKIFFQSNRPGSIGLGDLWVATRESTLDAWSTPVNLGSTINTTLVEQNAYLSSDGGTLLFSSDRPGGSGGLDLYMTTRTKLRGNSEK